MTKKTNKEHARLKTSQYFRPGVECRLVEQQKIDFQSLKYLLKYKGSRKEAGHILDV